MQHDTSAIDELRRIASAAGEGGNDLIRRQIERVCNRLESPAPVDREDTCPICANPLASDDICASDIELGVCHAACLEGSPVVDLETGEEIVGGKIDTYRYGEDPGAPTPPTTFHQEEKVMNDMAECIPAGVRITARPEAGPILLGINGRSVAIRAGTTIEINGTAHTFSVDTPVGVDELVAGRDYAVTIRADGTPVTVDASEINPLQADYPAGFHFAPGGCAEVRAGGDSTSAINPHSFWDQGFRPRCGDPRGMVCIEMDGYRLWVDIYLLSVSHANAGTSTFGAEIADGNSLDLLDFKTAAGIYAHHGKRLLTHREFYTATFGVTERSSAPRDPKTSGLDASRTSRFGLMQATGNLWIWGVDGDPDDPRPSVFGGSWFDGSGAGSRCAFLACWPGRSNENFSARGACDHL